MSLFRRIFGGGTPPATDKPVELGDRYFQVGMGKAVWVVERICESNNCDIQHVVIHRVGTFPDTKIISVSTLHNPTMYRLDRRVSDDPDGAKNKRRKTDNLAVH